MAGVVTRRKTTTSPPSGCNATSPWMTASIVGFIAVPTLTGLAMFPLSATTQTKPAMSGAGPTW
eukprot:14767639-Heterocapsa_arctica.AAC.1